MKFLLILICSVCWLKGQSQSDIIKKVNVQYGTGRSETVMLTFRCLPENITLEKPLLLIDDEFSEVSALRQMNIKDIDWIEVVQGDEAIRKYGDKAKGGAVLIYLKASAVKRAYI